MFQDPGTSLNPLLTLERQITESLEAHRQLTRRQARGRALELLEAVGLPDPETRLHSYPHQLSGGQRQRVMIAIALACDPELLIADEPTTSLDVTTQAQIIELVRRSAARLRHRGGVDQPRPRRHRPGRRRRHRAAATARPWSRRRSLDVFDHPQQPYTRELLQARPLVGGSGPPPAPDDAEALLEVDGLDVRFAGDDAGRQVDRPRGQGPVVSDPARHARSAWSASRVRASRRWPPH